MVIEGLDALEAIVTLPLELAALAGVKTTFNFTLCATARVTGVVAPLRLNPVPLMLI